MAVCFLTLKPPYVRVVLDRSRQEEKEEKSMPNPIELSMAAKVKSHSSWTRDKMVGSEVLWNLREQGPVWADS